MFARIRGAEFKKVIGRLIDDKRGDVCLAWVNGRLLAQTTGNVIDEMELPVIEYTAGDDGVHEATVLFEKSVALLSDAEVVLKTSATILTVTQGNFRYNAQLQSVTRVDTSSFDSTDKHVFPEEDINSLRAIIRNTLRISRALKVEESTVNIVDNFAYIYYSNFAVITECKLVNCALDTKSIARLANVVATRRAGTTMYSHIEEKGILSVSTMSTSKCIVTVQRADHRLSTALEMAIKNSKEVGTYNFSKYQDNINVLTQVYDKYPLELSFHETGLGFFINNQMSQFSFGETSKPITALTLTPAQLLVLNKIMGGISNVKVLRGDRKLCFKGQKTTVLISGMLS